jgi:hypothetical protein
MRSTVPSTVPGEPAPIDWLDEAEVQRVRAALERRTQFPEPAGPIEQVQTHISTVLLTPRYVFKFKRPVDVGFADFSTLALRERFCRAELRLNRRLAPGVYLDVLPLTRVADGYALAGSGPVVDWCVVMTRLDPARMLDQRLRAGDIAPEEIDALAARLADFHRDAADGPAVARFGGLATVRGNWDENFRQTEPFVGTALSAADFHALREGVEAWLARHQGLLEARARDGFVRDGHGDLRCEHIDLGPPIRIIDCIEFNERFRFADVANDLAFLLMDLTALGHPGTARRLLERYTAHSGDRALARLVPFYACYRATVRGKVTAFKLHDRNLSAAQRAATTERARGYFRLARSFLRELPPPVLVLVAGLMGTGKTALAEALAARAGLRAFNSDAVRKALAAERHGPGADGAPAGAGAAWGQGLYSAAWTDRTYEALLARAEAELREGRSVILDASFARATQREAALALAARLGARCVLLECRLDEAHTLQRLRRRTAEGRSVSDGREALYATQRAAFEPIAGLPPEAHLVVVTDRAPESLADALLPALHLPAPLFSAGG